MPSILCCVCLVKLADVTTSCSCMQVKRYARIANDRLVNETFAGRCQRGCNPTCKADVPGLEHCLQLSDRHPRQLFPALFGSLLLRGPV